MRAPSETVAAIGFRAHTGWAAAVVIARPWQIVERRRLAYEPERTRFIYHHASEIASDAEVVIEAARAEATEKARQEIENLIAEVRRKGKTVLAAGVPGGNVKLPDSLAEILGSHARIHAAEGVFYRDVLADACKSVGIDVARMPERDLWTVAGRAAGLGDDKLRDRIDRLGKELGPPWAEDQKLATLAALAALGD